MAGLYSLCIISYEIIHVIKVLLNDNGNVSPKIIYVIIIGMLMINAIIIMIVYINLINNVIKFVTHASHKSCLSKVINKSEATFYIKSAGYTYIGKIVSGIIMFIGIIFVNFVLLFDVWFLQIIYYTDSTFIVSYAILLIVCTYSILQVNILLFKQLRNLFTSYS